MNTFPSLYPVHPSQQFYVAYLRDDEAKEPLTVNESIPRAIADAAAKLAGQGTISRSGRSLASATKSSSNFLG